MDILQFVGAIVWFVALVVVTAIGLDLLKLPDLRG